MAADGLTKLASSDVLLMLRAAMDAQPPDIASAEQNFKSEEATWWAAMIRAHRASGHEPTGQRRLCDSRAAGGLETIDERDIDVHNGHHKTKWEDADVSYRNLKVQVEGLDLREEQAQQPATQPASTQPAPEAVEDGFGYGSDSELTIC